MTNTSDSPQGRSGSHRSEPAQGQGYQEARERIWRASLRHDTSLDLTNLRLVALPTDIGELTRLTTLRLDHNKLRTLPRQIGDLPHLRNLGLTDNELTTLPPEIGWLIRLNTLNLDQNKLTTLPREIGQLLELHTLSVRRNLLTALPPDIGRLSNLTHGGLDLRSNALTDLPPELGHLPTNVLIHLGDNPLQDPLPSLIAKGTKELFAYLRSLKDSESQFEAKLLLVGEGNVGKTCLVDALTGKPFVADRSTTHGIEVATLDVEHPSLNRPITLHAWDFGGQAVYRITHQFFFSQRSLYLVVWHPRQGQEQNEVEGWIRRIRLRVGDAARIILVATHADDGRNPDLDYPSLTARFGGIVVGHVSVDNASGTGVQALQDIIRAQAAQLPQMGERISKRWTEATNDILGRSEPHMPWTEFVRICRAHRMTLRETETLASRLHYLGHVVYYGDDEGLRDIVVLQPEWLTKAIHHVLEDRPTRDARGKLDHGRLKYIWRGLAYSKKYHPYFLRLMEKFDISYRFKDEDHASLVAQLVPFERPQLPWDVVHEALDTRTLRLICSMGDEAPGLISWLTVRNHRFESKGHWRSGVFLRYAAYDSEALFELLDERRLALTVRAPSPDYFFSILRDSLEELISLRWPGMKHELIVPCPARLDTGVDCEGYFELRTLQRWREQGDVRIRCRECDKSFDIAWLLTGFATPTLALEEALQQVREEVKSGFRRNEALAADTANQVRTVLRIVSTEVVDCPRLFTIEPLEKDIRSVSFWTLRYKLVLCCEHPDHRHPWDAASYEVSRPREWFVQIAPYLRLVMKILRLVGPVAGAGTALILSDKKTRFEHPLNFMDKLVDALPEPRQPSDSPLAREGELPGAEGAGLRALRALVFEKDKSQFFGGLRRFQNPSGDFLWICPEHSLEYDEGLPVID